MKRSALMVWLASGALAVAAAPALPTVANAAVGPPAAAGAAPSTGGYHEPLCESRSSLCADTYDSPGDEYVGHDEPSVLFKSGVRGSGNDITYTVTLPRNPRTQPNASGAGGTT